MKSDGYIEGIEGTFPMEGTFELATPHPASVSLSRNGDTERVRFDYGSFSKTFEGPVDGIKSIVDGNGIVSVEFSGFREVH